LSIPISPILSPLMLALDVTAAVTILYLLHSLFTCNLLLIPTCYPKLLSIGWVEPCQRPTCPDCPAGFSEDPCNGIEDQTWAPHLTFPRSCSTLLGYRRVPRVTPL
jgi:hypothetical protein